MKIKQIMFYGLLAFFTCCTSVVASVNKKKLQATYNELKSIYDVLSPRVIRPAEGYLKYPYLIPAGFYTQMWDWDGYFMGCYFMSKGHPELLRNWALNLLAGVDESGYVSGCATTKGPRAIFGKFSMKPFLAQGILLSSQTLGDFEWVKPWYDRLKLTQIYREKTQRDTKTGLFFWQIAMQSGADNNVALNYFEADKRSFLACDASTLQAREYEAMSILARKLGYADDKVIYANKAKDLCTRINRYLWCPKDKMYYNVDRETGKWYKHVSYSNFWPLFSGMASSSDGKAMIKRYLLNPKHMLSPYGLRSLSGEDVEYNNKNIIVPFSNWQGPLWMNANYMYGIILKNYGFTRKLDWLAQTLGQLMIKDYKKYGSLHESYDAETGSPLAPADSYVDKNGKYIGFISWNLCIENLLQGVVENKWMTMELK